MSEVFLRHILICFRKTVPVTAVNTHSYTQPHMLRSFYNTFVDLHQIRMFQCFEPEIINKIITCIITQRIHFFFPVKQEVFVQYIRNQWVGYPMLIFIGM